MSTWPGLAWVADGPRIWRSSWLWRLPLHLETHLWAPMAALPLPCPLPLRLNMTSCCWDITARARPLFKPAPPSHNLFSFFNLLSREYFKLQETKLPTGPISLMPFFVWILWMFKVFFQWTDAYFQIATGHTHTWPHWVLKDLERNTNRRI